MPTIDWAAHPGLDDALLALYDGTDEKRTSPEAALELSMAYGLPITGHKVRNRYAELRAKGEVENTRKPFEAAYEEFNRYIGYAPHEFEIPKSLEAQRRRYLVLSDLHIPFHNKEALASIVQSHPEMDGVILAGDFLDCYSLSRFLKERDAPLQDELAQGKAVLTTLAERYPKVWAIGGNHERRSLNFFAQRLPAELLFLVSYNLLEYITHNLPNVEIVKNEHKDVTTEHFFELGDCVIAHAETTSKVPLKHVQGFEEWLRKWRYALEQKSWRAIMQAHSHQGGQFYAHGGEILWMELGSLVTLKGMDYALRGDVKYSPPTLGYGLLVQDEGRTDFGETRFIPLAA